jgi:hypothetical protein
MVYLNVLKNKNLQPRQPQQPKLLNLVEGSRFESELLIFFNKLTTTWHCYNGKGYPVSYIDNRLTFMPLLQLADDAEYTTYSIPNVAICDIAIDNSWVTLLSYEPTEHPITTSLPTSLPIDDSGLTEGKCNLKNITFTFDGQRWYFMNQGTKIYFHSDILKTNFADYEIGIEQGQTITFREITGNLVFAGKYWIFILHRKQKEQ